MQTSHQITMAVSDSGGISMARFSYPTMTSAVFVTKPRLDLFSCRSVANRISRTTMHVVLHASFLIDPLLRGWRITVFQTSFPKTIYSSRTYPPERGPHMAISHGPRIRAVTGYGCLNPGCARIVAAVARFSSSGFHTPPPTPAGVTGRGGRPAGTGVLGLELATSFVSTSGI
ncbi:hypothetical protein J6590_021398 [Homalodisca vitripennis]|nr:hypothetical protein J6590_021398 [Homalodisca vitripennis]